MTQDTQLKADSVARSFKGLSIIFAMSGYIFGPMIVLGGTGIWLGRRFDSVLIPIVFLLVALVAANILIFKKGPAIAEKLNKKK